MRFACYRNGHWWSFRCERSRPIHKSTKVDNPPDISVTWWCHWIHRKQFRRTLKKRNLNYLNYLARLNAFTGSRVYLESSSSDGMICPEGNTDSVTTRHDHCSLRIPSTKSAYRPSSCFHYKTIYSWFNRFKRKKSEKKDYIHRKFRYDRNYNFQLPYRSWQMWERSWNEEP